MAEKLALPLILPSPPSPKPIFPNHINYHPQPSPSPPPLAPLLQDVLRQNFYSSDSLDGLSQSLSQPQSQNRIPASNFRERTRIGRSHDPNRGKPWTHHRLSPQGQAFVQKLIDPSFDTGQIDAHLVQLIELYREDGPFNLEFLSMELLGIVKGLGFNKKGDLALSVVDWVRSRKGYALALTGSVIAVVVNILGKEGKVAAADALLHSLRKDDFEVDVYAYTALISAFASNGRYRDAVMVFKKMEEEGCKPTLITYNVVLNVYGKMGMPWNKIIDLIEGMKGSGTPPDLYTYNTLISCCRRGSLYEEAAGFFEEMKLAGFSPDKVTYNALLDA